MEIIFYIGILLVILFGPWVLVWRVNSRRKRDRQEDQSRWNDLTARFHILERELRELKQARISQPRNRSSRITNDHRT